MPPAPYDGGGIKKWSWVSGSKPQKLQVLLSIIWCLNKSPFRGLRPSLKRVRAVCESLLPKVCNLFGLFWYSISFSLVLKAFKDGEFLVTNGRLFHSWTVLGKKESWDRRVCVYGTIKFRLFLGL